MNISKKYFTKEFSVFKQIEALAFLNKNRQDFSCLIFGSGGRIRTNDLPGMNRPL